MSRRTRRFWDRVSKMARTSTELGPTALKIVGAAREHLSKDSVILDVGSGTGDLTLAIARNVASVRGIDGSQGMVNVAKIRAAKYGIKNVDFAQGDFIAMAPLGGTFTAVTAFNVLHYIKDIPEAVQQAGQQLAPGGLFLSSTACLGERRSVLRALTSILMKLGIMPNTHFLNKADLTSFIISGGFRIVSVKEVSPLPEYFIVAEKAV